MAGPGAGRPWPAAAGGGIAYGGHAWRGLLLRILGPLLVLLAAPQSALIAGLGRRARRGLARRLPHRGRAWRILRAALQPLPAALAFIGTLYLWELPPLQNAAQAQALLGALMRGTFLLTGLWFFATLFHPQDPPHGPAHVRRQLMLTAAPLPPLLLGAAFTITPLIPPPAHHLGLGRGAGGLQGEYDGTGIPFDPIGTRSDRLAQTVRFIKAHMAPGQLDISGSQVNARGYEGAPQPIQKPHPPIVVGGHSPAAFRRVAARGNGWFGSATPDARPAVLEQIERAKAEVDRAADLGEIEITIMGMTEINFDTARRYADLGVDRVTFLTSGSSEDEIIRSIEEQGEATVRKLA